MARNKLKRRPKGGQAHVRIHMWVMKTDAWKSLTPKARVMLLEIAARYNGTNNGRIGLGVREAAHATNMDKDTCAAAFKELQAKGFLVRKTEGFFKARIQHAAEWLWTEHRDDVTGELPLKWFVRWRVGDDANSFSLSQNAPRLDPPFPTS